MAVDGLIRMLVVVAALLSQVSVAWHLGPLPHLGRSRVLELRSTGAIGSCGSNQRSSDSYLRCAARRQVGRASLSPLLMTATMEESQKAQVLCREIQQQTKESRPLTQLMQARPGRGALKCKPIGIGCAAPQRKITNKDMEQIVETTEEWITSRTGIQARHVLDGRETLRDLGIRAAKDALAQSGLKPEDIDLVIVATSSPDDMFGDAPNLATAIGARRAFAYDLTAACSGFLFGTVTAAQFVHSGAATNALVVGADALSRWVDWSDRNTAVLFGDGAGAMVLTATQTAEEGGILGFEMHSDGAGYCHLKLPYGGKELAVGPSHSVTQGKYEVLTMTGKEVYKFATREVPRVLEEALANAGLRVEDVDWLLLHQANIRIMEVVADRLGIPMSKVLHNLEEYGNTSAASIPLALAEAIAAGKVKKGDVIACAGFGAGLSWGATVMRWG